MNKACIFFKISDIVMHYPRNFQKFPDVVKVKNLAYDENFGKYTKADAYYTENLPEYPVIINVHGGGFVRGDKKHRRSVSCEFAKRGFFVLNVNYRLAPKYPFPSAIDDVIKAMNYLLTIKDRFRLNLDKIILTGDSAGGFYSAAAIIACVNENYRKELNLTAPLLKPTHFMGFCGAYNLCEILTRKTPLNMAFDIADALMKIKTHKDINVLKANPMLPFTDLTSFVTPDFPESYLMYSVVDDFCGGQGELFSSALKSNNVPLTEFIAMDKKDFHCFHLLPKHKDSKMCLDSAKAFLDKIK